MFGFGELTRIGAELQRAVVARDGAGIMRLKHRMAEFVSRVKVESASIDDDAVTSESGTRDSSVTVRRNHVLLVDDDEMNRILIAHYLEKEGYTVAQAASGEEALAALEIRPLPALILLDVVMPDVSGLDVCRHIKASPSTGAIPVVLLTALEKNEDRFRGMEAGADDFVTKPVTRVDLLARVSTLLSRPKHTAR
jgi:CheY-like chemotaxis protein